MNKIKIDAGGYALNGKLITPMNITELSDEEIKTLSETHASAWEILKIRASNHELINAINRVFSTCALNCGTTLTINTAITKQLEEIQKSLFVTQTNGKTIKVPISDAVSELLELHKPERKRKLLLDVAGQYKSRIIVMIAILLFGSMFFHDYINAGLEKVQGWVFVLIPASGMFALALKLIFERVFKIKDS